MSAPADELISQEKERNLFRRLVAGEETALSDVARVFLDSLIAWLKARNSTDVPEELCIEAAQDALIALVKSPQSHKPDRGKRLFSYLRMSAQADLQNILRGEGRYRNQISLDDVELSRDGGKYLAVKDDLPGSKDNMVTVVLPQQSAQWPPRRRSFALRVGRTAATAGNGKFCQPTMASQW